MVNMWNYEKGVCDRDLTNITKPKGVYCSLYRQLKKHQCAYIYIDSFRVVGNNKIVCR